MFDQKAYITTYVVRSTYIVRNTRSILDRNLICFIITPPQQLNSHLSFLAAHIHVKIRIEESSVSVGWLVAWHQVAAEMGFFCGVTWQWENINLAIIVSKRKNYRTFFPIHVLGDESFYIFVRWWGQLLRMCINRITVN